MSKSEELKIKNITKLAIIQKQNIELNGLAFDFKIEDKKIKIELNEEVQLEDENKIKFEYEGYIYIVLISIDEDGVIEIKKLNDYYKNKDRVVNINKYGTLTYKKDELQINIKKINKNKVFFNVLKKDEDLIFNALESDSIIKFEIENQKIEIKVNPVIENISDTDDILVFSEIDILDNKELFEKFIEKEEKNQNKKEKQILMNNLIKEIS